MTATRNEMGYPNFPGFPDKPDDQSVHDRSDMLAKWLIGALTVAFLAGAIWLKGCVTPRLVGAAEINLAVIATIESNNNPLAYNRHSGAVGLFQITPVCLNDYNLCHKTRYEVTDLLSPKFNYAVAYWYFNQRIPQMLRAKGKAVNIHNILHAYNSGIGRLCKGIMPRETREYIKKYVRLTAR